MNKLYFRAWLKDEKRMVYAHSIDFSSPNPDNGEFREVGIWDVDGEFHEGFIGIHIDIMQGIEIDGKVVYEGDIVEFDTRAEGFKGLDVIKGDWRLFETTIRSLEDLTGVLLFFKETYGARNLKIIGNIYENK